LNIAEDLLPVSPASHYCMGGVRTDLHGRTTFAGTLRGGRSRLHRRSRRKSSGVKFLLEGLVFGARAGQSDDRRQFKIQSFKFKLKIRNPKSEIRKSGNFDAVKKRVKRLMWERVGILRDARFFARALARV
jgi:L-aspartate oxidase